MASHPWMKFYPADWRADPALRSCSLAARGLWIELIGFMHEAEPYGHLLIGGSKPSHGLIGKLTGVHHNAVTALVTELVTKGVASVSPEGVIFSRRMLRDNEKAIKNKENGEKGGNPILVGSVNPQVKAHIPEARFKKEETSISVASATASLIEFPAVQTKKPEARVYERGKEILGKSAGALITNLFNAKGRNIPETLSVLEMAAGSENARQYVSGVIKRAANASRELLAGDSLWRDNL